MTEQKYKPYALHGSWSNEEEQKIKDFFLRFEPELVEREFDYWIFVRRSIDGIEFCSAKRVMDLEEIHGEDLEEVLSSIEASYTTMRSDERKNLMSAVDTILALG